MNSTETTWVKTRRERYLTLKKDTPKIDSFREMLIGAECKSKFFGKEPNVFIMDTIQFGKLVNANDFDENIVIPSASVNSQINFYINELFDEIQNNIKGKFEFASNKQREVEMTWISKNVETLKKYRGQWICINKNELINCNKSLKQLLASVKALGIIKPFVYYLPTEEKVDHSIGL